jgi:DNA repair protein RadA/Sms
MAKQKINFICRECGNIVPKWEGKCSECGAWGSFDEEKVENITYQQRNVFFSEIKKLNEINDTELKRIKTGINEFDQVLGGGLVNGSVILVGGEPGIGKSTIMLQVASLLQNKKKNVIYVSGEESTSQIYMRGKRLKLSNDDFYVISTNNFEEIITILKTNETDILIIDSIQTIHSEELTSAAGTVSQVKFITHKLVQIAKSENISIFIIGQVTKEGAIAGPRILEHLVDTVLYFEGDYTRGVRILRAVKNRFGPTNEVAIFEMKSEGLYELSELSLIDSNEKVPGKAFSSVSEGSRVFIVEIQALVTKTFYNFPKRNSIGFDLNRLQMLIAILEKKVGLNISGCDIYLNVAGGLKLNDPSADLAICAAIVSSFVDKPANNDTVFIGEVGLTGKVSPTPNIKGRLLEANKFGFKKAVVPEKNEEKSDLQILTIDNISNLMNFVR